MPFIAVTSFLCLRFISPAIMAPKLFHLRERHADARTSRTLLLLAKVRDFGHWREVPSWLLNRGPCLDCRVFPTGSRKALWQASGTLMWRCTSQFTELSHGHPVSWIDRKSVV